MAFAQEKIMSVKVSLLLLLLTMSTLSQTEDKGGIDCSFFISGLNMPATCYLNFIEANQSGHNLRVVGGIDLQNAFNQFPQMISDALYKRSCEERVAVKSASASIGNNKIHAHVQVWIEKRSCSKLGKFRLFEKTGDVRVSLTPEVRPNEIRLVADVTETGLSDFEEKLMDLIGIHPREKIKRHLDDLLKLKLNELPLPEGLEKSIGFRAMEFTHDPPTAQVELTAELNAGTVVKLINFWGRSYTEQ